MVTQTYTTHPPEAQGALWTVDLDEYRTVARLVASTREGGAGLKPEHDVVTPPHVLLAQIADVEQRIDGLRGGDPYLRGQLEKRRDALYRHLVTGSSVERVARTNGRPAQGRMESVA